MHLPHANSLHDQSGMVSDSQCKHQQGPELSGNRGPANQPNREPGITIAPHSASRRMHRRKLHLAPHSKPDPTSHQWADGQAPDPTSPKADRQANSAMLPKNINVGKPTYLIDHLHKQQACEQEDDHCHAFLQGLHNKVIIRGAKSHRRTAYRNINHQHEQWPHEQDDDLHSKALLQGPHIQCSQGGPLGPLPWHDAPNMSST
mmetsp:Transcript_47664/g.111178  ORF Transcript_47664/g.111178 Transcript_47664/m.111178 type:complete len:203 (-) Transcript_47664:66-674(-)